MDFTRPFVPTEHARRLWDEEHRQWLAGVFEWPRLNANGDLEQEAHQSSRKLDLEQRPMAWREREQQVLREQFVDQQARAFGELLEQQPQQLKQQQQQRKELSDKQRAERAFVKEDYDIDLSIWHFVGEMPIKDPGAGKEWTLTGCRVCGNGKWVRTHFKKVPAGTAAAEAAAAAAVAAAAAFSTEAAPEAAEAAVAAETEATATEAAVAGNFCRNGGTTGKAPPPACP